MKKVGFLILIAAVFGLTSCTKTLYFTSIGQYNETLSEVEASLAQEGYELAGSENEDRKEQAYMGTSTSRVGNRVSTKPVVFTDNYTDHTYTFANSEGDEIELYMQCIEAYDKRRDCNYFSSVKWIGCKTNNADVYEKICGNGSVVKQKLSNMEKDLDIEESSAVGTVIYLISVLSIPVIALFVASFFV